jgi:hypothetical protein
MCTMKRKQWAEALRYSSSVVKKGRKHIVEVSQEAHWGLGRRVATSAI